MLSRTVRNCLAVVTLGQAMFSQPSVPAAKAAVQPAVGFIHDTDGFLNNSGCSLWLLHDRTNSTSRYVLLSDFSDNAVMNIGGRDTALRLVDSTDAADPSQKGARSTKHYRGKGVDVVVRYTLTHVCSPTDEACEAEGYNATLTVQTHSGKRVVRAQGVCGS
jgi:hypothetical protein